MEEMPKKPDANAMPKSELLSKATRISEPIIKRIFLLYSSDKRCLSKDDLTNLIADVLRFNDLPPIIVPKLIPAIISELSLETETDLSVDFTEFKSFCIYFNSDPIKFFIESAQNLISLPMAELAKNAALISIFERKPEENKNAEKGSENGSKKDETRQIEILGELVAAKLKESGIFANQVIGFFSKKIRRFDFLTVFETAEEREKLFRVLGAEFKVEDFSATATRYKNEELPRKINEKTEAISQVAAQGLILGHKTMQRARTMATDYGVPERLSTVNKTIEGYAKNIDEKIKFSENFNEFSRKASKNIKSVDESIGFSKGVETASEGIYSGFESLKNTEAIQTGLSYISGVFSSFSSGFNSIKDDAIQLAEAEIRDADSDLNAGQNGEEKSTEQNGENTNEKSLETKIEEAPDEIENKEKEKDEKKEQSYQPLQDEIELSEAGDAKDAEDVEDSAGEKLETAGEQEAVEQ